jgi:hypothetical protein
MKFNNMFFALAIILSFNLSSISPSEAHGHGGGGGGHEHGGGWHDHGHDGWHDHDHWHGGWHGDWHGDWHGGGWHHWGWGWGAPLVVQPYSYYTPTYAVDGVARANHLIDVGRQKIQQGNWYINHGDPGTGNALINEGQTMVARGKAILGR